eukprot:5825914-Prymnesium_polylepis.1
MCALDRPDRLVIRPPRPAGPEDLQPLCCTHVYKEIHDDHASNVARRLTAAPARALPLAREHELRHRRDRRPGRLLGRPPRA